MVLGMFDCNFQKLDIKTQISLDKNYKLVYNKIINIQFILFHKGVIFTCYQFQNTKLY